MLEWLRKLMSGDQTAEPPAGGVERDEQGRITRATQTLSLAEDGADTPAFPALVPDDSMAPRLREACDWLIGQNIRLARERGLGLERSYDFDQDSGRLTLKFMRGRTIAAHAQILGSFDPRDRSFLWAWANPSLLPAICEDAGRAKAEGERLGFVALKTPTQTVVFDDLMPLLAFAARAGGADGVYRAIVNGSTSVFLSLRFDEPARKPRAAAPIDENMLEAAHALVTAYDAEMLPIDREHHERSDEDGLLRELMARKLAIYQRYWARNDSYWEPSSLGWPSDHDPDMKAVCFTVPHPQGGALDIAIGKHVGETVYRIEPVDGALKITDQLLDWGAGFIWPSASG
ncbi:DUF6882 domain-containing protein [Sphingopyxis sp.]|uniref:DUF6882 domain-containing protein n=1 Tax=Sphingopyxis sp. TaxID=1908224 RepID=UPI002D776DB9|nr:DUF6882 domain-containing protein [Sphingopyxis sp.]HET6523537.1 hypothetical protein [Sphingopyxis sp.]